MSRSRFDVEAVRDRAGDRTFARGEDYQRGGCVTVLELGPDAVLAQVSGSENYRTVVTGRGGRIGGERS